MDSSPVTRSPVARIGVVVHGPEIVDSGRALTLINYLEKFGIVSTVLGGTMGRVAVIDAGLEGIVSINAKRRPSISIRDLARDSDIIFLINEAKSRETGQAFGTMVARAAAIDRPIIQIDCGGRFVADLTGVAYLSRPGGVEDECSETASKTTFEAVSGTAFEIASMVASDLGLDLLSPPTLHSVSRRDGEIRRRLTGVLPGELISINGTVVGRATGSEVEIAATGGRIVDISGAEPKEHGLEKLPEVDLERALIRSGSIRRSFAQARIREDEGDKDGAAFIDHCAEDAFELAEGASVALTVGDDTTAIAGDILARMGVPIVGIVDGDPDHMAQKLIAAPGSVIIQVEAGYDDVIGRQMKEEIFLGQERIKISVQELAANVTDLAAEHLVGIKEVG